MPDLQFLYGNLTGKVSLYDVSSKKTLLDGHVESKYQRCVSLQRSLFVDRSLRSFQALCTTASI